MSIMDWVKKEAVMPLKEGKFWGDVVTGKTSLRDAWGEHNRIHSDATKELGNNVFTKNPDATAGVIAAAIMSGGSALGAGAGGGAGAAGGGTAASAGVMGATPASGAGAGYSAGGGFGGFATKLGRAGNIMQQLGAMQPDQPSPELPPQSNVVVEIPDPAQGSLYVTSDRNAKRPAAGKAMRDVAESGNPIDTNGMHIGAIKALSSRVADLKSKLSKLQGAKA